MIISNANRVERLYCKNISSQLRGQTGFVCAVDNEKDLHLDSVWKERIELIPLIPNGNDVYVCEEDAYTYIISNHNESKKVFVYQTALLRSHINKASAGIRFITSDYNELFRLADGEQIKVIYKHGTEDVFECRYIDDYHTQIGNIIYHICEFAEIAERNGYVIEPAEKRAVLVQVDYKGSYERFALSYSEFLVKYPEALAPTTEWQSETVKPMVHVSYLLCEKDSVIWKEFLTDMKWGLSEMDITANNLAYVKAECCASLKEDVENTIKGTAAAKRIFRLPVSWTVCSSVDVMAESLDEAIRIFNENIEDIPTTTDGEYLEGSYQLDGTSETLGEYATSTDMGCSPILVCENNGTVEITKQ